jgi:hypothetical protein
MREIAAAAVAVGAGDAVGVDTAVGAVSADGAVAADGAGSAVGLVAAVGAGAGVKTNKRHHHHNKKKKTKFSPNPHEDPTSYQEEEDSPTGDIVPTTPPSPQPQTPEGLLSQTEGLISQTEPLKYAELEAMHNEIVQKCV